MAHSRDRHQAYLDLHSQERSLLKRSLDSLTSAADSVEEQDEPLAELLLSLGDLLDGFLRSRRGVYLSNEPWRSMDVSPTTTLSVLEKLTQGSPADDDRKRHIQLELDACGLSLSKVQSPFADRRQGIA